MQSELATEKDILLSRSLAIDKERVRLATLMTALFYDLATEKEGRLPTAPEQRERKLLSVIGKRRKPVVLFVDEAHDLHHRTLLGIKRLMELVRSGGATLSVVLAGHPKLKNDLRRPHLEEIGARAEVFTLEGIRSHQRQYIEWLLNECAIEGIQPEDVLTEEAMVLLTERLATPLQVEHYLRRTFEEAHKPGFLTNAEKKGVKTC
ncbi:AAA family ATPase [Floridanema evergladense]|uniref:AAA family ATPase n=1 Tax=Floridaenema evergladense BLCC-F167 TaxID=3153639 RepID=A0ABV4WRP1_9CYAN